MKASCLYIVAVPIGNYGDITLRAIEVLQQADVVICENYREASTLLKKLNISKEMTLLNEHTEEEDISSLMEHLRAGKSCALISDCGTPVFSDPGHRLVELASAEGFPVVPIPGPSSLMAALSICDFKLEQFTFNGFLPRDKKERNHTLLKLKRLSMPIVLMDTPYRLKQLLENVMELFGGNQEIILACDLTLSGEHIYRGPIRMILQEIGNRKAEFVLIIK